MDPLGRYRIQFNPLKAQKKTIYGYLDKTDFLKRIRVMDLSDGEIFTEVGSILKGQPKLKELRQMLADFKKKRDFFFSTTFKSERKITSSSFIN